MSDDLVRLADLVRERNALELAISALISRPAAIGHIGEFIASRIFGITLEQSASARGIDGGLWDAAELYPSPRCSELLLTEQQRRQIALFASAAPGSL
jgi:hypothetical protein